MDKKLWGGRFSKPMDKTVEAFTASIHYDSRLVEHDIRGSIAHARMLGRQGIIPKADAEKIVAGLGEILIDYHQGRIEWDPAAEDVHMNVEKILFSKIGDVAGKLHTARSRNDQIATDIRLYLKAETDAIVDLIVKLQQTLVDLASQNLDTILPGYTHLQHAQPVLLAHHLLVYFWMFERDKGRFIDCRKRLDVLPLGSGALAGTSFPLDREFVARELGFASISPNSLDAVADRDFAVEFLSACSITMMHLSRFAEEIVLWMSQEFRFIELDDAFTTGSSIMPQKKNPDVAELTRGKTGRVYGDLNAMLTILKGLPLSYNRDLQEDKEPLFDAVDTVELTLTVFQGMLATARFNRDRMYEATQKDFSTATDLADFLVRQDIPFRRAHEIVGKLVAYCLDKGKDLTELTVAELKEFAPEASEDALKVLGVQSSVNSRKVPGGTGREAVERQLEQARGILTAD